DRESRPYSAEHCSQALWPLKFAQIADGHLRSDGDVEEAIRSMDWSEYEIPEIHIPNTIVAFQEQLDGLMNSPVLPKTICAQVERLRRTMRQNITTVGTVLNACAKELPEK